MQWGTTLPICLRLCIDGRKYPWGNRTTGDTSNYRAVVGREIIGGLAQRILRGGSYDTQRMHAHCAQCRPADPATQSTLIGFRVALDG